MEKTIEHGKWTVCYNYYDNGRLHTKEYFKEDSPLGELGNQYRWDKDGKVVYERYSDKRDGRRVDRLYSDGEIFTLNGRRVSEEEYKRTMLIKKLAGI